jgi:aspartyl-tRNA(Asn)/glutamyl-tRNA(Gln) amidotransferase subunit A
MPIGMQIIGDVLREDLVLEVAHAYEQATHWHVKRPEIAPD